MFAHELSVCRNKLCFYQHREKEEIDKSINKDANDVKITNGDESDKMNTEDNLDMDNSEFEDDYETEIIRSAV